RPSADGLAALRRINDDPVLLDDGVGEELLAHRFDAGPGLGGVLRVVEIELDDLAEPHALHFAEPQRSERPADSLALRIEHRTLQRDDDACFHSRPPPASGAP